MPTMDTALIVALGAVALALVAIVLAARSAAGRRAPARADADAGAIAPHGIRVVDADVDADVDPSLGARGARADDVAIVRARAPGELADVADALGEGVVRVDRDGLVAFANLAAHRLLERRPGSVAGLSAMQAFLDHRVEDLIAVARVRGSATADLAPRISGGRHLVVRARTGSDGGVWVVLEDVTDLRRLQRMRTEFIDNLSHELRTPITNINLLAETLARGGDQLPPRARDRVERIQVEAAQLAQMVSELLDLAAIEGGQPLMLSEADLVDVARAQAERLRVFAERQGVEIVVEAPAAVPPVRGDAARLGQAILNLVHNAVKFSEPGDRVAVRVMAAGDEVSVVVTDEGAGIPRADLDRVFERFYKVDRARQRGVGGTGLGLSIVRHVVEQHGGRVTVASDEGVGSTFTITVPVEGPVTGADVADEPGASSGRAADPEVPT